MNSKTEMGSLVEGVVRAIEKGIRKGEYMPGDQLVERELAKELGVSRIPVREALRRLAAQHILQIRPYRGAIVRRLSRSEVSDVIDILHALGVLAVTRAAERIDEGDARKRLKEFMAKKYSYEKRDKKIKEWVDINFPFYHLISEISQNRLVPELNKQFQLQMYRLAWDVELNPGSQKTTFNDHAAIAEAILAGDVKAALAAYTLSHQHAVKTISELPDSAFADYEE